MAAGPVSAFTSVSDALTAAGGPSDLVVLAVKSANTAAAAAVAAQICHTDGTVVSVQNGDNLQTLRDVLGDDRWVKTMSLLLFFCVTR